MPGSRGWFSEKDASKIAQLIYDEWIKEDNFTVADRLATGVSPEVAKFAIYEIMRVAEHREEYVDVHEAVERLLELFKHDVEKALEACRDIAIRAVSLRFREETRERR
mgnify:CR=1 FL=1